MESSVLSFGKNMYGRLRESVMSSSYRSPYSLVDEDDDNDDDESVQSPSNMFFSVQAPKQDSIPLTDSRAFYNERITQGDDDTSELYDSDYRGNQYSDGDLGYSDFSYARMSEFQSDAEEQPVSIC